MLYIAILLLSLLYFRYYDSVMLPMILWCDDRRCEENKKGWGRRKSVWRKNGRTSSKVRLTGACKHNLHSQNLSATGFCWNVRKSCFSMLASECRGELLLYYWCTNYICNCPTYNCSNDRLGWGGWGGNQHETIESDSLGGRRSFNKSLGYRSPNNNPTNINKTIIKLFVGDEPDGILQILR